MLYQLRRFLRLPRFIWSLWFYGDAITWALENSHFVDKRGGIYCAGSLAWFPGVVERGLERGGDVSLAIDLVEATHQQHYAEGV